MPKPIEPSPMTAIFGFAVSAIGVSCSLLSRFCRLAYHGLAALPKRERNTCYD